MDISGTDNCFRLMYLITELIKSVQFSEFCTLFRHHFHSVKYNCKMGSAKLTTSCSWKTLHLDLIALRFTDNLKDGAAIVLYLKSLSGDKLSFFLIFFCVRWPWQHSLNPKLKCTSTKLTRKRGWHVTRTYHLPHCYHNNVFFFLNLVIRTDT